jgi:hypothetical protein
MQTDKDDVDPDEVRRRFREVFDALYKKPTKPRDLNLRTAPSQPVSATPDKCR